MGKGEELESYFEVIITFLYDDSGIQEDKRILIPIDKFNDIEYVYELIEFIKCVKSAVDLDNMSRKNSGSYLDANRYYHLIKNFHKFFTHTNREDDIRKGLCECKNQEFFIEIPCDSHGYFSSFKMVSAKSFDKDGCRYEVLD